MDDLSLAHEAYPDFDDQADIPFSYLPNMSTWPLSIDPANPDTVAAQQHSSQPQHPHHHPPTAQHPPHSAEYTHFHQPSHPRSMIPTHWYQPPQQQQQQQQQQHPPPSAPPSQQHQHQHQQQQQQRQHHQQPSHLVQPSTLLDHTGQHFDPSAYPQLQPSPLNFIAQHQPTLNTAIPHGAYTTSMDSYTPLVTYQHDLQSNLVGYPIDPQARLQQAQHPQRYHHQQQPFGQPGLLGTSPSDHTDNLSSSGSEGGWQIVDYPRASFDGYHAADAIPVTASVSNPGLTLHHIRTDSDTSQDLPGSARSVGSFDSFDAVSPGYSDEHVDNQVPHYPQLANQAQPPVDAGGRVSPASSPSASSSTSPVSPSATSPTQRRKKERGVTKSTAKAPKPAGPAPKKAVTAAGEKRVGRRRGPLLPEQRIQAREIRKLRACLRCKFLKKTCDKGDPCAGCQPSHARLWQVPCTRIDIKDIGYFIKDWKADYDRHVTLSFSIANIRGYSPLERPMLLSHGFGYFMTIQAREVFVRDEDCFNLDWTETQMDPPQQFDVPTARLTAGIDGISIQLLSEYLDRHIDEGFERFVDQQFQGTLFLTEMLKTTYAYYQRTQLPVIRKALKLILAYNLTQHITLVDGLSEEESQVGRIDDECSRYYGQTLAPVMINFQVKHALAMVWRDLQKDVLEELSALFASVYSGEKLKNWPTICVLVFILLAVWEEIQFDSHFRQPDTDSVKKFCQDMENIPVGVIVGLFQAISQKLPAFQEWDTNKHHQLLYSNPAVCDAMTEIREHVVKYEEYLKSRTECKFDRDDFDSLSNKFTSKLVIRAH